MVSEKERETGSRSCSPLETQELVYLDFILKEIESHENAFRRWGAVYHDLIFIFKRFLWSH